MKQKYFGITLCLIIFTAGIVAAFSSGPPDGRTDAPGQSNCTVGCHSSFPLNSGNGIITVTAALSYSPNDVIPITVNISQMGQSRWGFEATMLDLSGNPVGTFTNTTTRTQTSTTLGIQYIKHTSTGTDAGVANASLGWQFTWTAPAVSAGHVKLYIAANAANNNGLNSGDFIYTDALIIDEAPASCCIADRGNVDGGPDNGTLAGSIDIADLVYLVAFMFQGGAPPPCIEEANIDGLGVIDISDLVALVGFMFQNGPPPAPCL